MGVVVEALDGGFLERAVHAFDLAVGPRVARFGKPMIDVVLGTGVFEGVGAERLCAVHGTPYLRGGRADIPGRGKMRSVVCQHGVDGVGHGLDEGAQEVSGDAPGGLLVQFDERELGDPVDSNQEIEPALSGLDLCIKV